MVSKTTSILAAVLALSGFPAFAWFSTPENWNAAYIAAGNDFDTTPTAYYQLILRIVPATEGNAKFLGLVKSQIEALK